MTRRSAAWGGIIGPAAFVGAWVVGSAIAPHYSPVDDAISRLAAVHADTRPLMTAGFIIFGIGVPLYAWALRDALDGPAWCTAAAAGIATLLVAAAPLDHSSAVDTLHGVFAGTGYVALALTPLLAVRPFRSTGRMGWARASIAAAVGSGICLALTTAGPAHGLFQRLGLTMTDAWIIATAAAIVRGRLPLDAPVQSAASREH